MKSFSHTTMWTAAWAVACSLFTVSQAATIRAEKRTPSGDFYLYGYADEFGDDSPYVLYISDGLAYVGDRDTYSGAVLTFSDTSVLNSSGAAMYVDTTSGAYTQIGFTDDPTSTQTTTGFTWYGDWLMLEDSNGDLVDPFWAQEVDDLYAVYWNVDSTTETDGFFLNVRDIAS